MLPDLQLNVNRAAMFDAIRDLFLELTKLARIATAALEIEVNKTQRTR